MGPSLDAGAKAVLFNNIGSDNRKNFETYLGFIPLGLAVILGPTGLRLNTLLAVTTLLYIYNDGIKKVYCSAPTDTAVTAFAKSLHDLGAATSVALGRGIPLVVRGHPFEVEAEAFINVVSGRPYNTEVDRINEYSKLKWSISLSVCEWLLKIVDFEDFRLEATDGTTLLTLRHAFVSEGKYAGLRKFVKARARTGSRTRARAEAQIRELFAEIVMNADAICTIPHTSGEPVYADYNANVAKGVAFADAGAMWQADALLIWGKGMRPAVMAGDPKRARPNVLMHNKARKGKAINLFSNLARVSELEQVTRGGWPCFRLKAQRSPNSQNPPIGFRAIKHTGLRHNNTSPRNQDWCGGGVGGGSVREQDGGPRHQVSARARRGGERTGGDKVLSGVATSAGVACGEETSHTT